MPSRTDPWLAPWVLVRSAAASAASSTTTRAKGSSTVISAISAEWVSSQRTRPARPCCCRTPVLPLAYRRDAPRSARGRERLHLGPSLRSSQLHISATGSRTPCCIFPSLSPPSSRGCCGPHALGLPPRAEVASPPCPLPAALPVLLRRPRQLFPLRPLRVLLQRLHQRRAQGARTAQFVPSPVVRPSVP